MLAKLLASVRLLGAQSPHLVASSIERLMMLSHLVMSIQKRRIVVNPEFTTILPAFYPRRDRDSNPGCLKGTTVFETAPFDRSGISPLR